MIDIKKVPTAQLDLSTGKILNAPAPTPNTQTLNPEELIKQVYDLAKKGIPLDKVLQAIDAHPDIQDKGQAKQVASQNYPQRSLSEFVPNQPNQ